MSTAEALVLAHQPTDGPLQPAHIRAQVNLIQEVMKGVMKNGTHFGIIPGTPKPSLWKPGAEKLLSTFRIALGNYIVDDLSTDDEIRYRVIARAESVTSGAYLGDGIGECSSNEAKYRWRAPVCQQEFDETPEDRRREVWKSGGKRGPYQQKQVRTYPTDIANTILKMAKKRAMIDVTLQVTAAGDIFAQDIEDLPEEIAREIAQEEVAPEVPKVQRASEQKQPEPEPKAAPKAEAPKEKPSGVKVLDTQHLRSGQSAKGPWSLYKIILTSGEFTTFSETVVDVAEQAKETGAAVTIVKKPGRNEGEFQIDSMKVIE